MSWTVICWVNICLDFFLAVKRPEIQIENVGLLYLVSITYIIGAILSNKHNMISGSKTIKISALAQMTVLGNYEDWLDTSPRQSYLRP